LQSSELRLSALDEPVSNRKPTRTGIKIDFEERDISLSTAKKNNKDLNRSSLTASRPQSILKNTNNHQSSYSKALNSSRSSPIQPSSKKKVNFQLPFKKDKKFVPEMKLQRLKLKLKLLKNKKMILEKVYEKEKKDNELVLKNKMIYME
jgi:hypothetical protein